MYCLFVQANVQDLIRTATKPRPNRARLQLWLMVSSFVFVMLGYMAPIFVMFPFAQKVYLWDSQKYSTYNSTAMLLNSVGMIIFLSSKIMDVQMPMINIERL